MTNDTKGLDRAFRISIALKGLDGALEIIGGLTLLFVSPTTIQQIIRAPTICCGRVRTYRAGTTLFAVLYPLTHGVAKVVLVVAVLRDQIWAYPAIIVLLLAFIVYQLYRLALRPTIALTLLTLFDAVVVVLTWKEYPAPNIRGHR